MRRVERRGGGGEKYAGAGWQQPRSLTPRLLLHVQRAAAFDFAHQAAFEFVHHLRAVLFSSSFQSFGHGVAVMKERVSSQSG